MPEHPQPGPTPQDETRTLVGKNISGQAMPPYSLVRRVRYVRDGINRRGYYEIDLPNEDSNPWPCGVTGKAAILSGAYGPFTSDFPNWVRYSTYDYQGDDTYQGTMEGYHPEEYDAGYGGEVPQVGDYWGPAVGAFEIHEDQTGFRIEGVDPINHLALVGIVGGAGGVVVTFAVGVCDATY